MRGEQQKTPVRPWPRRTLVHAWHEVRTGDGGHDLGRQLRSISSQLDATVRSCRLWGWAGPRSESVARACSRSTGGTSRPVRPSVLGCGAAPFDRNCRPLDSTCSVCTRVSEPSEPHQEQANLCARERTRERTRGMVVTSRHSRSLSSVNFASSILCSATPTQASPGACGASTTVSMLTSSSCTKRVETG
jgi:hypothetical protein